MPRKTPASTRHPVRKLLVFLASSLLFGLPTVVLAETSVDASGEMKDPRDGQLYPTITVEGITWFARNLNFASPDSFCYDDEPANCARYGRLYRWEQVLSACPPGWHASTEYEWQALEIAVSLPFSELAGRANRGTDQGAHLKVGGETGFDTLFGGWRDDDGSGYRAIDANAAFWTSTESDLNHAWHRDIDIDDDMIWRSRVYKPYALSLRCVQDWLDADRSTAEGPDDDCWLLDNHVWWSPDSSRLVVYSSCDRFDGAQIVTLDPDGSDPVTLARNTGSNHSPEWSPDGSQIAFYSNAHAPKAEELHGAFDIYVMDADGDNLRRLTHAAGRDGGPVWSPDGARIAFYSYRDDDAEIYMMNSDGSGLVRVTEAEGYDFPMGWSRRDDRLLAYSNRRGNFDVLTMRPDGSDARWLTDDPADEEMPALSADGKQIIYTWDDGTTSRLMIRHLDGGEPVVVGESQTTIFDQPTFSPDGQWIGYSVGNRGDATTERFWRTVMIARPDGSEARALRGEVRE